MDGTKFYREELECKNDGRQGIMGKDNYLINIYLKIHNKRTLTMDDLSYLAEYDPECFEKTCKNVIYNIPEIKSIMEPEILKVPGDEAEPEVYEWQNIGKILENLKRMEINEIPVADIDTDEVKNLLGNLYMELLFPHNDKYAFVNMADHSNASMFDQKI